MPKVRMAELDSWLGYVPIAVVEPEPAEFEETLGIVFDDSHDELDDVQQAVVRGEAGRIFALVRHIRSPNPGTEVFWDEREGDISAALLDALLTLDIPLEQVLWVTPTLTPAAAARMNTRSDQLPAPGSGVSPISSLAPSSRPSQARTRPAGSGRLVASKGRNATAKGKSTRAGKGKRASKTSKSIRGRSAAEASVRTLTSGKTTTEKVETAKATRETEEQSRRKGEATRESKKDV